MSQDLVQHAGSDCSNIFSIWVIYLPATTSVVDFFHLRRQICLKYLEINVQQSVHESHFGDGRSRLKTAQFSNMD